MGEKILVATGRVPNLEDIDADRIGLAKGGHFIRANNRMETNIPGLHATGDLVVGMMLAHAAIAEGEVAPFGMTEQEAMDSGCSVKVGRFPYMFSEKAHATGQVDGFVKIIGDGDAGKILGVHLVGDRATELIGEPLLAMTMEASVEDLGEVIKGHPTVSECVREAALD